MPSINLSEFDVEPDIISIVPSEVAQRYQMIPINRAGATLIVAMADPSNIFAIDDIKFMTGYNVEIVVAAEAAIKEAIDKYGVVSGGYLSIKRVLRCHPFSNRDHFDPVPKKVHY